MCFRTLFVCFHVGKQAGGDEGSGTRSSLMYETIRIVEKLKPKYVICDISNISSIFRT